ncbi:MAG: DUF2461 domain-containing protein [bacterium]|nr:DUF2461 domain-containing protein [bacterium]
MIDSAKFTGFSQETFSFLKELGDNNSKKWFDLNRKRYEDHVLTPFRALVEELGDFMLTIDPRFEIAPAVNKTISRIYRDTRFSKDKKPFRNNMWLTFKVRSKNWHDRPGYYFEIFPDWYRYGMGFFSASPATMSKFREMIDDDPDEFTDAISFMKSGTFEMKGDDYKRIKGDEKPKEIKDWYRKKSFYLSSEGQKMKNLFGVGLVDELILGFGQSSSLYHYLCKVIDNVKRESAANKPF